jgi:DNA-binding MarR family transcriptional regulator
MTRRSPALRGTDSQTAARMRLVVTRLAKAVRQHGAGGLTPSQLSALATIEDLGPIRISDLASREAVGAPVATRIVASLEHLGYLKRFEDSSDRRACLIDLSSKGRHNLKKLWGERNAGLTSRIENLNDEDLALLQAALPVLEILARDPLILRPRL